MRKPFVAGNWKMHLRTGEAADLVTTLAAKIQHVDDVDVALCPPFTALATARDRMRGTRMLLGAQNCHVAEKDGKLLHQGAYTGEVSAPMLADLGVQWVILGHSERRQYFGETDASVNRKARAVYEAGMLPIICVGETLAEREAGTTATVVEAQVRGCLEGLSRDLVGKSAIAYEPVWAIGTGRTASPEQAQEVHAQIRALLTTLFGEGVSSAMRIQYGGSMKANNARELLRQPDIDGGLIGGASLSAEEFAEVVLAARK